MAVKLYVGSIEDKLFSDSRVGVINCINAATLRNYGVTKRIYDKFPYGDVVSGRRPAPGGSICCKTDRPRPGTVETKINWKPEYASQFFDVHEQIEQMNKMDDCNMSPIIFNCITSFNIGDVFNKNDISKRAAKYESDPEMKKLIKNDRLTDRAAHFAICLDKIKDYLTETSIELKFFVIPIGSGSGTPELDPLWVSIYVEFLRKFAAETTLDVVICTYKPTFYKITTDKTDKYSCYRTLFDNIQTVQTLEISSDSEEEGDDPGSAMDRVLQKISKKKQDNATLPGQGDETTQLNLPDLDTNQTTSSMVNYSLQELQSPSTSDVVNASNLQDQQSPSTSGTNKRRREEDIESEFQDLFNIPISVTTSMKKSDVGSNIPTFNVEIEKRKTKKKKSVI